MGAKQSVMTTTRKQTILLVLQDWVGWPLPGQLQLFMLPTGLVASSLLLMTVEDVS